MLWLLTVLSLAVGVFAEVKAQEAPGGAYYDRSWAVVIGIDQ
jgi:hypothetical protein